ncbi:GPP34 family phosphoprotein [Actinomadura sp. WMMA1423]|uniref:GOLPH3/VPS74 family protein n=1 Tax=Actinomadura sp. WMMA1423 TaxID=2591108 RepID=UPI0011476B94|nr:GPP34 family phosphoprotein [Actinomadura sp. WMMA1423]
MTPPMTLAEEVMLLSLDDEKGDAKEPSRVQWAVAGAMVVDLALAGRIDVEDERVHVRDPSPVGVPYLDAELADLAERGEAPKVKKVIEHARKTGVKGARQSLIDRGLVREEKKKVLGIFSVSRYPEADGAAERELRDRLEAVVEHGRSPDERTAALVALLHGARLRKLAFGGGDRRRTETRMKEIAEGQWVSPAVRRAVDGAEAAMVAVITTTTIAATG